MNEEVFKLEKAYYREELTDTVILESQETDTSTVSADISLPEGKYYAEIVKNGYKKHCLDFEVTANTVIDTIKLITGDIINSSTRISVTELSM